MTERRAAYRAGHSTARRADQGVARRRTFALLLLLRQAGLPEPQLEYHFHPKRRWRFDLAWPERRLALEIDGGEWLEHGGRHNSDTDREKLNAAATLGWRVLRVSGKMVDRQPSECCRMVLEAFAQTEQEARQKAVVDLAVQLAGTSDPVLFYRCLARLRQSVSALGTDSATTERRGEI